jgi:predicted esterase
MSDSQKITFSYQATYQTVGRADATQLCLVLHGYGQLASYFIQKFSFLEDNAYIVAPEGLSHFYLQGTDGRVGASWMTKEKRELAIQNYLAYLDEVYGQVMKSLVRAPEKLILLGFSQGVSTLIRWIVASKIEFDQLIMCAGDFPKDIDKSAAVHLFREKPCYYLYGDEDPYLTNGSLNRLQSIFMEYGLKVEASMFHGKHEVDISSLKKIIKKSH